MTILAGIDIGGTKCAVSLGKVNAGRIDIVSKRSFPTSPSPMETIKALLNILKELLSERQIDVPNAIGISCGGPLDSKAGLILSPPNLPLWDRIDIVRPFQEQYGVPTALQNDANACALAEWKWGAGKGYENLIFLTFGTGMGAGLILNGRLYSGTNDMAGEIGHVRLQEDGPIGYGKAGSFEGFCSGGGIARLAQSLAKNSLENGNVPLFCESITELDSITAKKVGEAAKQGDKLALQVFNIVGKNLGRGLSLLVDILNPECIILGSIYGRQLHLLEPIVKDILQKEALPRSLSACSVVPAGLGENVGDFAALSVALYILEKK